MTIGPVMIGSAVVGRILCTPLPGMANTIVSGPVAAFESRMACRSEPVPLSLTFVTVNAAAAQRLSRFSTRSRGRVDFCRRTRRVRFPLVLNHVLPSMTCLRWMFRNDGPRESSSGSGSPEYHHLRFRMNSSEFGVVWFAILHLAYCPRAQGLGLGLLAQGGVDHRQKKLFLAGTCRS